MKRPRMAEEADYRTWKARAAALLECQGISAGLKPLRADIVDGRPADSLRETRHATHPFGFGALRVGVRGEQRTRERRDHLSVVCRVRRPRWRRAQLWLLDLPTMHGHGLGQRRLLRNQHDVPRPPTRDDPAASRAPRAIRLLVWLGGLGRRAQQRSVLRRDTRMPTAQGLHPGQGVAGCRGSSSGIRLQRAVTR
jgi:hypothetical protein